MDMLGVNDWLKSVQTIESQIVRNNAINLERAKPSMIEANEAQLDQGKRSDGTTINPLYSPNYAKKKGFSTPNLLDKGDFREGFFVELTDNTIDIKSTDYKMPFLIERYNPQIMGVNVNNLTLILNEEVYQKDYDYISRVTDRAL